ncbi:MAG: hypothetical protein D6828_03220, partial [Nitrospirae bacterium]
DVESGKVIRTFRGHTAPVISVSIGRDGRSCVSASSDNTLKLWDMKSGRCLKTINLLWIPLEVKFYPNDSDKFAVAGANATVALFDLSKGDQGWRSG